MAESLIPKVDLSFLQREDLDGKNKAMETITKASSEYGFFQIVNHGIPLDLMKRVKEQSKIFFDLPDEEKRKHSARFTGAIHPLGYNKHEPESENKNEFVMVYSPKSKFYAYPQNPPEFRDALEELFVQMSKTVLVMEDIVNECLGLPPNFLKEYNNDRSLDFMAALHYFPASSNENVGITQHEDSNCITLVMQDEAGGLEVRKKGEWIPVVPAEGTIVVNIGDVIQVLSNKKFKSATHRVVRPVGRSRYSFAFFHNIVGDKWIEPLPQFTKEIGEPPKYKGFLFKDYQYLKIRHKTHPPAQPEDEIQVAHYEIDT